MIQRLREFPSPDELDELYAKPYDHRRWNEHERRVAHSIQVLHQRMSAALVMGTLRTVADLSCGDGAIINSFKSYVPKIKLIKGDFVPDASLDVVGRIEDTIHTLQYTDLFICTETLEHLEYPASFLAELREKTRWLFLTTPIGEPPEGPVNPEHIWSWNLDDMRTMLTTAGFTGEYDIFVQPHYTYQIWTCR